MFKFSSEKKAVSPVVATLLLIAVAIVTVALLWAPVKLLIEKQSKDIGTAQECFTLSLSIDEAVYNESEATDNLKISVKRGSGEANLAKLKIVVDGEILDTPEDVPEILETNNYYFTVDEKPEKIEVAGVLKDDTTCASADTAEGSEITTEE